MMVLEHTPALALIVLAVAAALAAGAFSAWRSLPRTIAHVGILLLYTTSVVALFWCLLIPGLRDATTQVIKPRFLVALDVSASMTNLPRDHVETRWQRAQRALAMPWVDALSAEADIELHPFGAELDGRVPRADWPALHPDHQATRLQEELHQLAGRYAGLNIAGLLVLSDGLDTQEISDEWASTALPFPVFTVRLEDDAEWRQDPNLRVETIITPRRVSRGWKSELKAVISGEGTDGQPVAVQLFKDDALVEETPVQIPAMGGRREVAFNLDHPETGIFTYRVRATPVPGETLIEDNELSTTLSVADPRNRLLYVEGVPRFEYRFLRRTLLANDQIAPAMFFSGADGTPISGTPSANVTAGMSESELLQFKVVILGNLDRDELGDERAAQLVKFVETGGSLILLGGTRGWGAAGFTRTPLNALLPVVSLATNPLEGEKPFPVELEPGARAHPAFAGDDRMWEKVPPVLSVFPDAALKSGAEVLVSAITPRGRQPVVVTQRYGQGRVAAIFTDTLWRWQLTPEASAQQPYGRFWTQLLAWMIPEADESEQRKIDLFASKDHMYRGEPVRLSARHRGDAKANEAGPPIEAAITFPDGRVAPYAMTPQQVVMEGGRTFAGYRLDFTPEAPGHYMVVATSGTGPDARASDPVSFNVRAYSPETMPRPARADVLRALAAASGGRYAETLDQLNATLTDLPVRVVEEQRAEFRTLWRRWPIVAALMLLFTGTWALRKTRFMP